MVAANSGIGRVEVRPGRSASARRCGGRGGGIGDRIGDRSGEKAAPNLAARIAAGKADKSVEKAGDCRTGSRRALRGRKSARHLAQERRLACRQTDSRPRAAPGRRAHVFDRPPQRPQREPGPPPEPADLQAVSTAWLPVVARDGRPIGFRLALRKAAGSRPPASLAALLAGVLGAFEADGAATFPHGLVLLAALDLDVDASMQSFTAPRNVLLEVGQHELDDERKVALLFDAQRHGVRLALRVEYRHAIPRERLPLFQYVVADMKSHGPAPPDTALLAMHVDSRAAVQAAFKDGANAVIGWPLHEAALKAPGALQPNQKAVLDLIRLVQADADVCQLERAFKGEPVLAYLLLTLANSPAFIRSSPIASLTQAISLLGYRRLVKWLVLLLVIASKASQAMPYIYAAVARGFAMENLATATGAAGSTRDDCFVAGVFSLLDKITGQSLGQLVSEVALPAPVSEALLAGCGPYADYLGLALALEAGDQDCLDVHSSALHLPRAKVNAALLQALAATDALQSVI
jgi:EAL and modified HD-GYP domain-containing signal transduction protein